MSANILDAERQYLSNLLEAIQRCVYFLHASDSKITWPLDAEKLAMRKMNNCSSPCLPLMNVSQSCRTPWVRQCGMPPC